MKTVTPKMRLAFAVSAIALSIFSIFSIPVNAASGAVTISNSTTFTSPDPIASAEMHVIICNSSNQPINIAVPTGQSKTISGLAAGNYRAVVLGYYYYVDGVGGGGTDIRIPNPLGIQACTGLIPSYLNQTFEIQDNFVTNVSLSGIFTYNNSPDTSFRYWYTMNTSTPGVSKIEFYSENTFGLQFASSTQIGILPKDSICLDGVVTALDPQGAITTTPGNHTINLVTDANICDPATPALNLNVLANTTYRNFRNYYQNADLLTGYVLNITSKAMSGGVTITPTSPNPITPVNTNSTAPISTNTTVTNTAPTIKSIENQPTPTQTTNLTETTKPSEVAGAKDNVDFDLTAPAGLIRTGGTVQEALGMIAIMALFAITVLAVLSNQKE